MGYYLRVTIFLGLILQVLAANILVLCPIDVKNYYYIIGPLIKELANGGHKVTIFTPMIYPPHDNITQFIVQDEFEYGNVDFPGTDDPIGTLTLMKNIGFSAVRGLFKNIKFQSLLLSNKNFDVVISADMPLSFGLAVIDYRFRAPGISILNHCSSAHSLLLLGEHFNPAYYPEFKSCVDDHMNFLERLSNVYSITTSIVFMNMWVIQLHEELLDSYSDKLPFLKNRPPLREIIANKSLVLIPTHHTVDYVHPYSDRVVNIAGINVKNHSEPLPDELENFISESEDGFILISWGSIVRGQKIEKCEQTLVSALHKIKQKVIWKRMNTTINVPPHVKVVSWIPQQDLLAHKKILLFMMHGGMNSFTEATHYGVPTITTPFFLDQCKNSQRLSNSGAGLFLHPNNFTVDAVMWAITEIANNPSYKEAALRRSVMFRHRLKTPVEEAVHWIEHVINFGNVLIPASSSLPIYQLYLLDLISMFLVILILVTIFFKIFVKRVYNIFKFGLGKRFIKFD